MTTYIHEDDRFDFDLEVTFDLDVPLADVLGVEWTWTGNWADGEPLMVAAGHTTPVPLPTVYRDHGPLIPLYPRPTASQYRAAIDPDYLDTEATGYIESRADYGERLAALARQASAVTIPQAPGQILAPSPLEQTGFRRFLNTLTRGGAR
ncbi:phiSA1p31-related protein [Streptomyces sp. NPDC005786]|uniref:phiSA1p31-related protein n=1 Tax=Streptomyces sp. NPDC005786 TaxID=3154891 RepID=UPI0033FDB503